MNAQDLLRWLVPGLFAVVGLALCLVRVDAVQRDNQTRANPLFALNRFRIFRYGAAGCLFALAAIFHFFN